MTRWRRQWHPTPVLLPGKSHGWRSLVGCSPWLSKSRTWWSDFTFTFHFHAVEEEMAAHSSVLAWRVPGMGEPGGLPSMGSHRVGHDWSDLAAAAAQWPGGKEIVVRSGGHGESIALKEVCVCVCLCLCLCVCVGRNGTKRRAVLAVTAKNDDNGGSKASLG